MKQLVSLAALAAMLSATGCTQQEVFTGDDENDEPVTLGISTGVLTTETKSVVGGSMITYAKANYASEALGLTLSDDVTNASVSKKKIICASTDKD